MGGCSLVWSLTFGLFVLIASLSATGSNSTHTFYHSHIQLLLVRRSLDSLLHLRFTSCHCRRSPVCHTAWRG